VKMFFWVLSSDSTRLNDPPNDAALMTSYLVNTIAMKGKCRLTDVRFPSTLFMSTVAHPPSSLHLASRTFVNAWRHSCISGSKPFK
jgi:hypothetical protein